MYLNPWPQKLLCGNLDSRHTTGLFAVGCIFHDQQGISAGAESLHPVPSFQAVYPHGFLLIYVDLHIIAALAPYHGIVHNKAAVGRNRTAIERCVDLDQGRRQVAVYGLKIGLKIQFALATAGGEQAESE